MTGNSADPAIRHIRKADFVVQPCSQEDAEDFIVRFHYSRSCPNTGTYRHGLYESQTQPLVGELLGVALWIPPTKGAALTLTDNWESVLCLSRLAVHPRLLTNAASFLLAASRRAIDRDRWPFLLTYADTNQGHKGTIYRADNWECMGEVPAGDTWTDSTGKQMGRKRGPKTLTRAEMVAMGFTENTKAPKIKFVRRDGR